MSMSPVHSAAARASLAALAEATETEVGGFSEGGGPAARASVLLATDSELGGFSECGGGPSRTTLLPGRESEGGGDAAGVGVEKEEAEAPAAAKEQRGGLHKFDADEVDVEGGKATADDFMDAFGFGGDDDAAPAEGDMLSIQAS